MKLYNFLKTKRENYQAHIKEDINMGLKEDNDIFEFVNDKFLILKDENVFVKKGQDVEIRWVENGSLELTFIEDENSSFDFMCDEDEDYDKYLTLY